MTTSTGFAAIAATFAVGFLFMSLQGLSFARRARHWPTVEGTITRSKLGPEYHAKLVHIAYVDVEYRYEVGGDTYTGTRVSFDTHQGDTRRIADRILARYREGNRVRVFHEPGNPSQSVLEPENLRRSRQAALVALAAGAAGVIAMTTDLFR